MGVIQGIDLNFLPLRREEERVGTMHLWLADLRRRYPQHAKILDSWTREKGPNVSKKRNIGES